MKIAMARMLSIKDELESLFTKDVPIQASWKISKFITRLEAEYVDFERNRLKIIQKYMDEKLGKVPAKEYEKFEKEMEDLLDVEVEVEFEKVYIGELGEISVPPLALAKMAFLFDENPPEDPEGPPEPEQPAEE